jgi:GcrA cell cycle regulator
MSWTAERTDELKALWSDGLSAGAIARILGDITRNGVIGKVHRLGLIGAGRPEHAKSDVVPLEPKAEVKPKLEAPKSIEMEPLRFEDGTFATLENINDRMCHWPIGDPCDANFHYCGLKRKPRSPYCEVHARKAYQPAPKNRRLY